MNEWYGQAAKKLKDEKKAGKYDRHASAMKNAVCEALDSFCRQNEEFAQAVVQGGAFEDCMKAVAKNCGSSISDLEAFRRAVQFYFPGADVKFHMTVNLCADVERDGNVDPELVDDVDSWAARKAAKTGPKVLSLEDFL